jgi:hypothetical protein
MVALPPAQQRKLAKGPVYRAIELAEDLETFGPHFYYNLLF